MSDDSTNTNEVIERTPPTRAEFVAALGRVLTHAESHGEVYTGAQSDLAIVREVYELAERGDGPVVDDDRA